MTVSAYNTRLTSFGPPSHASLNLSRRTPGLHSNLAAILLIGQFGLRSRTSYLTDLIKGVSGRLPIDHLTLGSPTTLEDLVVFWHGPCAE